MVVRSTGGPSAFSSTRCFSSNRPSAEKTRTKFMMLSSRMNPFIPSTCLAIASPSCRNCSPGSRISGWAAGRRTLRRLCRSPSSGPPTGTTYITSECSRRSCPRLRVPPIPVISIASSPALLRSLPRCNQVCVRCAARLFTRYILTFLAVLSQAMQEEFRGFSYAADFE
jgi:hypothetical protein